MSQRETGVSKLLARLAKITSAITLGLLPTAAWAQNGQPEPGAIGLQESVTPIMDSTIAFHNGLLMWIITLITIFVTALLIWVIIRYNKRANPNPSKFTHNTLIEIVWTVVPIIILIVIAVPSFGVLSDQMTVPDGERKYLGSNIFSRDSGEVVPAPELTVRVTGYQWYWGFEYPDLEGASFDSIMLSKEEIAESKPGQPYLLAVDNELVVPVDTTVRVEVTAADVIHAFAVPAFGVKTDAVPERLNETWFHVRKEGLYYGQCSELCGKDHAFMPIAVRVVSKEEFAAWAEIMKAEDDVAAANVTLASLN
ncbi:cytochrome c oxidase subunit 2 [Maritalea mobilis]|uniref:Cytochrome c oxidase subunit 2 n=1 Tax=Maritalea mobilis TaxID=483324 RepID=A0A4R6VP30_9HYPH|nr:cytochrome c oxidase subunit 2 [Maritalea mobilis]